MDVAAAPEPARGQVIVVGVDGSEPADRAVEWAAEHASRTGAAVRLVHVRQPAAGSPVSVQGRRYRAWSGGEEQLRQSLQRLHAAGVPATAQVSDGDPEAVLIGESQRADLLVLGAEGHGRHRGLLLGDVVQRCARDAACPLVVVPPQERTA